MSSTDVVSLGILVIVVLALLAAFAMSGGR
jgi:hypothetical protein